ncbi:MAG: pantoate--beta-alanine ligase [Dehalococcoidia bacterium]|nr:pantoate--beta-alanine ligase [Dehalococcoidia bacterium]
MRVIDTVAAMRQARVELKGKVGFVPTMGYLHEGHLILVRRSRQENDHTVVSIFVNPTQFGPQEDFQRYPRDPQRDLALLDKEGVELVFMPSVEEVYPPGFDTYVEPGSIAQRLEGAARPDHFRGVATVVLKLFNTVQPVRAYFGQKDAQQVAVVKKMVRDLDLGLEIVAVPTVREPDGLAMSSRNVYLSPAEREAALCLRRASQEASRLRAGGERRAEVLRRAMRAVIECEPLARLDYVSVADGATLEELDEVRPGALVSMAVWVGKTKLIDNISLE